MKPFDQLTIGEIVKLTPEQVAQYAPIIGEAQLKNTALRANIAKEIGKRIITKNISLLQKMLAGED